MKKNICFTAILIVLLSCTATAQRRLATRIQFDELDQIKRLDYPDGSFVDYQHDNETGVQSSVVYHHAAGGNGVNFVTGVNLSLSGLLTRVDSDQGTMTYGYDVLNRLTALRFDFAGTTRYHALDLTYNRWGFLDGYQRQDESLNRVFAFGFTDQGALRTFDAGAARATFKYDGRGNLTAIDGFDDGPAGLAIEDYDLPVGEGYDLENHRSDWRYDRAGRLIRDDRRQYYYNQNGRLAMVRDLATGLPLQSNLYDGDGFRLRHTDILKGETTYTLRDNAGRVISSKTDRPDAPDQAINFVLHNDRAVGKVSQEADNPEEVTHVFPDHLGSPAVTVDGGAVTHHEYGPYGRRMNGSAYAGAHGYTGHEDDRILGLTYMRARYQDPVSARFTVPDPARDLDPYRPATLNLYQYAANDPINRNNNLGFRVVSSLSS